MPRSSTASPEAPASRVDGPARAVVPAARQGRRSRPPQSAPLGSLTQRTTAAPEDCPSCGGDQVTSLALTLTDGTAVRFSSCRRCEHRRWETEDGELSIADVLAHTRRAD